MPTGACPAPGGILELMALSFRKAGFGPLSLVVLLTGCSFFTLGDEVAEDDDDDSAQTAGSSASGSAGAPPSAGSSGTGGSSAGSAAAGTGTGGASSGTSGGAGATQGGSANAGGSAGSSGALGGSAGSSAGGASGGGAGGTDTGGAAGSAGAAGGSAPTSCQALNASAQAFGGHCYLVNTTGVSWPGARDACVGLGAHLVTISSDGVGQTELDAENAFVWGLVGNMEVWLGLTDGKADDQRNDDMTPFTWITGEGIAIDKWSEGEPNNYEKECPGGGTCWEHCGYIPADRNGEWNDEICAVQKPYVCEWDMGG